MLTVVKTFIERRELIAALAWKNIVVRYKQAYLGLAWAVLRPLTLMFMFVLIRAFVDIDTGALPYPLLAFAALMPWMLFQDAVSEGVSSIVANASLIKKVYFPREIFPITTVVTKVVEFGVTVVVLALIMLWYGVAPTAHALWAPLVVVYVVLVALAVCFVGSALNVYFRDVSAAMPVVLALLMYASPVIYPLSLVKRRLLEERIAGEWSELLYTVYTANPMAGIIDSFQRTLLQGLSPDVHALLPGLVLTAVALPLSYAAFKRAERHFADLI